jgi:hypothetical protein
MTEAERNPTRHESLERRKLILGALFSFAYFLNGLVCEAQIAILAPLDHR